MNEPVFASVWDAIEDTPQQAANLRIRSALMRELEQIVRQQGMSEQEAARRFGVTQPRVADLLQGRIQQFSLEALMDMATVAGLFPRIVVEPLHRKAA